MKHAWLDVYIFKFHMGKKYYKVNNEEVIVNVTRRVRVEMLDAFGLLFSPTLKLRVVYAGLGS